MNRQGITTARWEHGFQLIKHILFMAVMPHRYIPGILSSGHMQTTPRAPTHTEGERVGG